jgi:hypothetical protein
MPVVRAGTTAGVGGTLAAVKSSIHQSRLFSGFLPPTSGDGAQTDETRAAGPAGPTPDANPHGSTLQTLRRSTTLMSFSALCVQVYCCTCINPLSIKLWRSD